jgi:hypothetical protein
MVNLQAATARLAMAARVRKETTLPIKWIARLQVGTSKSLKCPGPFGAFVRLPDCR